MIDKLSTCGCLSEKFLNGLRDDLKKEVENVEEEGKIDDHGASPPKPEEARQDHASNNYNSPSPCRFPVS